MRAFGDCSPVTVFVCLMSCASVAMFCTNPVIALLSLVGAAALWFIRRGTRGMSFHLLALALLIVLPILNMLFSHNGATVLLVINDNPITLESLLYGLRSAVMLVSVLYWFRSFSQIMTSDKLLYLLSRFSPKLALMLTTALRFIPRFREQFMRIENAQKALGLYKEDNFIDLAKGKLRVFSILVTWALENGITTADSMSARGYGIGHRTTYSPYRFRKSDGIIVGIALALMGICAAGMISGAVDFSFYPRVSSIPASPFSVAVYISYGILVMIPTIIEAEVMLRWHSLRSAI